MGQDKAHCIQVIITFFLASSSPVDMQTYELCCDMIDVVIDVSCIYGYDLTSNVKLYELPHFVAYMKK